MKYEGAYKGWGQEIRGNSCNMEVSCKAVRGRDVQSLRSSNYLKEKKWSAFGLLLSFMGLFADRYNSFVNAHFWGGWDTHFFLVAAQMHIALLDFGPTPSDIHQGWMIKVSKWNFPNSWQTGSHDLRKVHSNYIIQFCTRFRLEILRAARCAICAFHLPKSSL